MENVALLRTNIQSCQAPAGDNLFETELAALKARALVRFHGQVTKVANNRQRTGIQNN
jgi:hypothetical protein